MNRFAETVKPTKHEGASHKEFPELGLICLGQGCPTDMNNIPARQMFIPVFSMGAQRRIKILYMAYKRLKEQKEK